MPLRSKEGMHEDLSAVVIGITILVLALAGTWIARPVEEPGSRERYAKGWPSPLTATVGMPGGWADSPIEAFRDKSGGWNLLPVALGMGWVALVGGLGTVLGGRSLRAYLPGALVLVLLTVLAYLLAGQKVVKYYNLEYPLWALAVGLLVTNVAAAPRWLTPALLGEFFIKTGLVVFGGEVLVSRLLALGLPGLMTSWIVTPIVLTATYLFGVHVLRIESKPLCMTLSADM